jgi:predicted dehydrogenase
LRELSVVSRRASQSEKEVKQVTSKVRWGVLGVAKIAVKKVIPAMQRGNWSEVVAIASRDLAKAEQAAMSLRIPKAYGSYEQLLADPEIEAVYVPLPNHMHFEWTRKAAEAWKHVLCEKPITLTAEEARALVSVRDRTGVKIEEAFMVRTHPQWAGTLDLVRSGRIGKVRAAVGFFSYFNRDPENIRNVVEYGGGALMDIGCYLVHGSRLIFGQEPLKVSGAVERDPQMKTDWLTSAILEFPSGHCVFTCSTQLVAYQRIQFFGERGRIEIEIPFNAPPDRPCRLFVDDGSDLFGAGMETVAFDAVDQYTIQGDLFSRAIREGGDVAVPLEDSVKNMAVIEAIFRSANSGRSERP